MYLSSKISYYACLALCSVAIVVLVFEQFRIDECVEDNSFDHKKTNLINNNNNSIQLQPIVNKTNNNNNNNSRILTYGEFPRTKSYADRTKHRKRVKVLITSLPRAGSTFIGSLFNRNPEFAYLFETTRGFSERFDTDGCSTEVPEYVQNILTDLYDCNFTSLTKFMGDLKKGDFYSWDRVVRLSSSKRIYKCFPLPGDNDERKIQRNTTSIAIKEITLWSPKIPWLMKILGKDFHVLWLVRDVRGWVSSWLTDMFYISWGLHKQNMWTKFEFCDSFLTSGFFSTGQLARLQELLSNTEAQPHMRLAAWWTMETALSKYHLQRSGGKVMLVSYEHLSLYPMDAAQQIYEFLGRPIIDQYVVEYISYATRGGDVGNRYSTNRDSQQMASIWKQRLNMEQLKEIEDIASPLFEFFGYEKVADVNSNEDNKSKKDG